MKKINETDEFEKLIKVACMQYEDKMMNKKLKKMKNRRCRKNKIQK